ncbi:S8/S53 family peptidase [Tissierella sp.]|uniref:S8/S53 family peptidase n=1 Tax=Tissierella sp. TaxID=41274 RepID=UPI002865CB04|nr:S8/S53 family peptidase [Tissierella sp.]MDR7856776.1 S8/S53 family peptidase [Tissierella sp.]
MKRVLCLFMVIVTLLTGCTSSHTVQRESPEQLEYPSEQEQDEKQEQSKQEDQSEEPIKYNTMISPKSELSIVRKPEAADYTIYRPGKMLELPRYNPQLSEMWQVDLRSSDLTNLDLGENFEDLIYADFDSKTKWSDNLPDGFNHELIMELGKNPGLGLRELHEKGITGKGISIAIIDQALLVDHVEYKEQLKLYEEIHYINETRSINGPIASMHGPAVASIAVGKTVGVAPEANLYFIAETHGVYNEKREFEWDLTWVAKSIDRIVEINNIIPEGEKIRVISISLGIGEKMNGYAKVLESIEKAKQEGIYTIYVGSDPLRGLGRNPLKNPDDSASYLKGEFWKIYEYNNDDLLVPMDSRCTAGPSGNNDYAFYRQGGMSWAVPYVAGLYALACQINPSITPEVFWEIALDTGEIISLSNGDTLGNIVNPARLIEKIEKLK